MNRRELLLLIGAAAISRDLPGAAQTSELLLRTPGLEHLGMTVPDPKAAADFYGRIFNPQLFREKDPPPGSTSPSGRPTLRLEVPATRTMRRRGSITSVPSCRTTMPRT